MKKPVYIKGHLPRPIRQSILALKALPGSRLRRRLAGRHELPNGYKRIYFYHIRKTAGTSLNLAFLSVSGQEGKAVQDRIWKNHKGWGVAGDYLFVLHNNYLIERGDYFYAYSHTPSHELRLPPETFTITILRDPAKRLISHYRNLMHYKVTNTGTTHLGNEGHWLGNSFSSFLDNIPDNHLMRQLYMFSRTFNIDEAYECITKLNNVFFTENFSEGLAELSKRLQLDLQVHHGKSEYLSVDINTSEKERLRKMLEPEYTLINRVKKYLDTSSPKPTGQ